MRSAMRSGFDHSTLRSQRGVTLFGLMFWAIVVGMLAYVLLRVFPTVNEYITINRAIEKVAASSPNTVAEVRTAFERQKDIEYSISTISGKDLDVTKVNDKIVIAFAYNKEIELFGPVFLLIKYEGRSSSR
jgi:Tfp pilus assembly major pilin PilA